MKTGSVTLRTLHRLSAYLILVFLALHIANHLIGLTGQQNHIDAMEHLRPIYRNVLVEPIVLTAFAWQATTGLTLVVRGWRARTGVVAWAQAASGLTLALFLAIHVGAILIARRQGVDTNFNFAASGIHASVAAFFVPYYFLALVALGTHLGCALYWNFGRSRRWVDGGVLAGTLLGAVIVSTLAGLTIHVVIPRAYLAHWES